MITNIETIRSKHGIAEYRLPGWDADEEFVCKLRRPSATGLAAAVGHVPNPLLGVVAEMFMAGPKAVAKIPADQQAQALQAIARYALVEPTYDQLADAGVDLTDNQYHAIYAFALGGAIGLARFLAVVGFKPGGDGAGVPDAAVPAGGDP